MQRTVRRVDDSPRRKFHQLLPATAAAVLGSWLLVIVLAVPGCGNQSDVWEGKPQPHVMASFTPIYCFARNVMGDEGGLQILTRNSPHEYQLQAPDAIRLNTAAVFFRNGLGADDAMEKLVKNSGNSKLREIRLGDAVTTRVADHPEDPHVWLGLPQAIQMVGAVRDALAEADPGHADGYRRRADEYVAKLKKLHADGVALLAPKKNRRLVAFHDSLRYFAAAFDLEIVGNLREWDGIEKGSKNLVDLVKECKEKDVRVFVTEPGYPPGPAEELLKATKAHEGKLVVVDSLEAADPEQLSDPGYYERVMRENVNRLADALK